MQSSQTNDLQVTLMRKNTSDRTDNIVRNQIQTNRCQFQSGCKARSCVCQDKLSPVLELHLNVTFMQTENDSSLLFVPWLDQHICLQQVFSLAHHHQQRPVGT